MPWMNIRYIFRSFLRERLYAFITVLGLTIGLACGIVIFLFVKNELSYEAYHDKADRIYRVSQNFVTSGKPKKFSWTSPSLGPKLFREFPQIETFTRLKNIGRVLFQFDDRVFYEDDVAFADTNFFKVFTHKFIFGDPDNCLSEPGSLVLTEDLWHRYFGNENPVGKELILDTRYPLTVTAVIRNPPSNTHFFNTAYLSYLAWDQMASLPSLDWSLFEINDHTFLLFRKDFDRERFNAGWPAFYRKYIEADAKEYGQVYVPIFERLRDIHYHSDLPTEYRLDDRAFFITILSVGIFLLLLAGINYTNLATARSIRRLRAFSIQKVLGAGRFRLLTKIVLESLLVTLLSLVFAFGLVEYLLEFTGLPDLLGIRLADNFTRSGSILLGGFAVAVLIGLLAGLYPAIQLSRSSALPGSYGSAAIYSPGSRRIRQALVVCQLVLAVVAISLTLLMKSQVKYLETKELGFDKDDVILVPCQDSIINANIRNIRDELAGMASVRSVCSANSYPGFPSGGLYTFEGDSGMEEHNLDVFFVDYDFINTLGIRLLEGRDFSRDYASDRHNSILINQSLARYMTWKEPLGKMIKQGRNFDARVIGVVEDFNFRSLHQPLEPLMIRLQGDPGYNLIVKSSGHGTTEIIDYLEKRFREMAPARPFEYHFLEDSFNSQYSRDEKHLSLIGIFSGLCIFIACLGLFTIVSYSAERRTKEVGIRKVNGANTVQVLALFVRDFLILSTIALMLSTPLILWIFRLWLREFPYRTELRAGIFILTYTGILLITFLTVFYHSVRAARSNPVNSLRYE